MVTQTHNTQADVLSLLSGVAQELEKGRNKVGEPTVVEDVWVHAGHVWAPYVHDGLMAARPSDSYVCVCVYLCVLGRQYLPIYVCMCVYVDCVFSGKLQC